MADSKAPLLKNADSYENPDETIEDVIEPYLRGLTWRQVFNVGLGFLPMLFEAQLTFITIFTDAKPTWHCTETGTCTPDSNICNLPESSWSWDKPAHTSTVSEWSLDCATNSIVQGLPSSAFFMGCLIAGFALFFIGDLFGRKPMLFVSCLIMSASSLFTSFANNVWVYSSFRFLSGVGRSAVGTSALVMATECVDAKWRSKVGSVGFVVFSTGYLVLPLIAYLLRNNSWRILYFVISIPGIVFTFMILLFSKESPKWLLTQGRKQEAIEALKVLAGKDSKDLSFELPEVSANGYQLPKGKNLLSFFRTLRESRSLSLRFFLLITIAFGVGLVYYGVSLGVGYLGLDLYWGAVFNSLFQVLSFVVVYSTVTILQRRLSILSLTILSGLCCVVLCTPAAQVLLAVLGLDLVAFFSASTCFSLSLIYTAELFPTCARNSAVAMVWQALMLGGVVSPVLSAAAGSDNILSFGVFGVLSIATGLLVLFLPETVGVRSPADGKDEKLRSAA